MRKKSVLPSDSPLTNKLRKELIRSAVKKPELMILRLSHKDKVIKTKQQYIQIECRTGTFHLTVNEHGRLVIRDISTLGANLIVRPVVANVISLTSEH